MRAKLKDSSAYIHTLISSYAYVTMVEEKESMSLGWTCEQKDGGEGRRNHASTFCVNLKKKALCEVTEVTR